MTDWCILRTSPARTLTVEESLAEAGLDVWTPKATEVRRQGRERKTVEHDVPILPEIVFARSEHLSRLLTISKSPGMIYRVWDSEKKRMVAHEHPPFSVFRYLDGYPLVSDRSLDPLRLAERRAPQRARQCLIDAGSAVRYPGAGFDGLTGVVQNCQGQYALVLFPGFSIPVKISSRMLLAAA